MDSSALFKIGYGLYVITTNDGKRDNGMICNTVIQASSAPLRVVLTINKANYTHETILKTGKLNVNILSEEAPFAVFERYGFKSGRDADKLEGVEFTRSENGLAVLPKYANAVLSLKLHMYVNLESHGLFICDVVEAKELGSVPTMTYAYYQANVKPRPAAPASSPKEGAKKKWVCKICGYVYDPEENGGVAFEDLPKDWVCPWCKHPTSDFEPM